MADPSPVLVWFRHDLRLADNPALSAAVASGRPVVALYILEADAPGRRRPGDASRWWLHHALKCLATALAARGARLALRSGDAARQLDALVAETGACAIHWNRRYDPRGRAGDMAIAVALAARGIAVHETNAALLHEPSAIRTSEGAPFRVFTPFARACRQAGASPAPLAAPRWISDGAGRIASDALEDWNLAAACGARADSLGACWQVGEAAAARRLTGFLDTALHGYADARNRPGGETTSRLSAHLHFGEIGPRQIWHALHARGDATRDSLAFENELLWREFNHHLLSHWPDMAERNWRRAFDGFPWIEDRQALATWQHGRTGFPIVDAGMRELWHTGWMHNRVRMIVASFLVKHLMLSWRQGEAWFWDALVDADLANNVANWQWVAGCGADAAPYFRIFNPTLQGERFDPAGEYVRRWVPELARLPDSLVHRPWRADAATLAAAGLVLGSTYPRPIVDHAAARQRALAAFKNLRCTA
jgi:deoxyribodipyrimidine photo-lyase